MSRQSQADDCIQKGRCSCCHKVDPSPHQKSVVLRRAERVRKQMQGDGWRIRVWHNIKWYWAMLDPTGYLSVHVTSDGNYFALFNDEGKDTGIGSSAYHLTSHPTFADPNKCAQHQLRYVRSIIRRNIKHLQGVGERVESVFDTLLA